MRLAQFILVLKYWGAEEKIGLLEAVTDRITDRLKMERLSSYDLSLLNSENKVDTKIHNDTTTWFWHKVNSAIKGRFRKQWSFRTFQHICFVGAAYNKSLLGQKWALTKREFIPSWLLNRPFWFLSESVIMNCSRVKVHTRLYSLKVCKRSTCFDFGHIPITITVDFRSLFNTFLDESR